MGSNRATQVPCSRTSATGGPLVPATRAPEADESLDDILTRLVSGLTGLEGTRVRPRGQSTEWSGKAPSRQPQHAVNWCAVGVVSEAQDGTPALVHDPEGDGSTTLVRHMTLEVMASFYGPRSGGLAEMLRDGLYVAQNREFLFLHGISLIEVGTRRQIGDIVNVNTRRRSDLPFMLRRRVERTYPILNLLEVAGTLQRAVDGPDGPALSSQTFHTPEK